MKEYYLIYSNDNEPILIGTDNGFGVFWADQGMTVLMNMVDNYPEKLEHVKIKTSANKKLSVSEFLEAIEKLKVRIN